jgi:hypothetical protein
MLGQTYMNCSLSWITRPGMEAPDSTALAVAAGICIAAEEACSGTDSGRRRNNSFLSLVFTIHRIVNMTLTSYTIFTIEPILNPSEARATRSAWAAIGALTASRFQFFIADL